MPDKFNVSVSVDCVIINLESKDLGGIIELSINGRIICRFDLSFRCCSDGFSYFASEAVRRMGEVDLLVRFIGEKTEEYRTRHSFAPDWHFMPEANIPLYELSSYSREIARSKRCLSPWHYDEGVDDIVNEEPAFACGSSVTVVSNNKNSELIRSLIGEPLSSKILISGLLQDVYLHRSGLVHTSDRRIISNHAAYDVLLQNMMHARGGCRYITKNENFASICKDVCFMPFFDVYASKPWTLVSQISILALRNSIDIVKNSFVVVPATDKTGNNDYNNDLYDFISDCIGPEDCGNLIDVEGNELRHVKVLGAIYFEENSDEKVYWSDFISSYIDRLLEKYNNQQFSDCVAVIGDDAAAMQSRDLLSDYGKKKFLKINPSVDSWLYLVRVFRSSTVFISDMSANSLLLGLARKGSVVIISHPREDAVERKVAKNFLAIAHFTKLQVRI